MVSIDEDELGAESFDLVVEEGFDRALARDRGEGGRLDRAVGRQDSAGPGRRAGVGGDDFEPFDLELNRK